MIDFEKLVNKTLGYEGGLSDNTYDKGGLTKYGISQTNYPTVDIANLTKTDAIAIYKRDYFDKLHMELFADTQVCWKLFDIAVNGGVGRATEFVQTIMNLHVDGTMGSQTVVAITEYTKSQYWASNMLLLLRALQVRKYCGIANKDKTQKQFLDGWIKRGLDDGSDLL